MFHHYAQSSYALTCALPKVGDGSNDTNDTNDTGIIVVPQPPYYTTRTTTGPPLCMVPGDCASDRCCIDVNMGIRGGTKP